jgi:hypothetical protein
MKYKPEPTNQLRAALILIAIMVAVVGAFVVYAWFFGRGV